MKILHVLVNYFPSIGGTQIFYKGISENCVHTFQDEVEVFTVNSYYGPHSKQFKKIEKESEVINGVSIKRFSFIRKHIPFFTLLYILYFKITGKISEKLVQYINGPWSPRLIKAMNNTDADIISASPTSFMYMFYPLYRHKLQNPKPFVFQGAIHFSVHDTNTAILPKMLEAIKASEFYMCNTAFEKNKLVELGVDEKNIVITGSAVDMEKFSGGNRNIYRDKLSITDADILIGYIGRLEKTKSLDILLQSFVLANKKNSTLKLVIAGFETQYMHELQNEVNLLDSEMKSNIFFLTNLSEIEKSDLYNAIDILVLPSVNESFGMVFLEAWSCKKPVIGVNIGAVSSVISDGKDGLLMNPFDVNDLSNKLLTLSANADLRLELGINGYNKTMENYTWPIVTKKYRDTYLAAIEKFNKKRIVA